MQKLGSIIATMLVIYWQPVQVIFKTTSIGFDVWIRILLVSSAMVVAAEILKKSLRN
ncbi:MAG: cation transporting ATPase C-terminal domain-containing protein [Candidatus Methanoperedenaceae archaeon]|nr:cation transporting ATPase C-terminal domain-containing protein [Candidatus Methanoperedenaceae archaeon]